MAKNKLADVQSSSAYRAERLEIMDPGVVPQHPSSPNILLNVMLGGTGVAGVRRGISGNALRLLAHSRLPERNARIQRSLIMYLPLHLPGTRAFQWRVRAALLGSWAAAIALAPTSTTKLVLLAPLLAVALLGWILYRPSRWLYLFFFCLLALPPLPSASGGDSGVHVAPLAAAVGVLIGLVRLHIWRNLRGYLALAFIVFLAILLMSTGFAALYSGAQIAIGSLARVLLFSLGVYVFAYTTWQPAPKDSPDTLIVHALPVFPGHRRRRLCLFRFLFSVSGPCRIWSPVRVGGGKRDSSRAGLVL